MTSETKSPVDPVPAAENEAEPVQAEESPMVAFLQHQAKSAPMQQYNWENHAPHLRPVQNRSTGFTFRHGAGLKPPPRKNYLPSRDEVVSGIHSSLAKSVKMTLDTFPRRSPTEFLSCEDVFILFGQFFAERLLYRGKVKKLSHDPISYAKVQTTSIAERWDSYPGHCQNVRVHTFPHFLSNPPEHTRDGEETPIETRNMVRLLTEKWPVTLEAARTLHAESLVPIIEQWRWIHDGQNVAAEDVTITVPVRKGSTQGFPTKTRTVLKTEEKLTGSICLFVLDETTDALSISDIAQSASHLLDRIICVGDPVSYQQKFCELDRFFLPLVNQFVSDRDNLSRGPWAGSDGPFAFLFHHLRCLSSKLGPRDPLAHDDGLKLGRVSRVFSTESSVWIGEERISIAVLARYRITQGSDPDLKRYNGLLLVTPDSERLEERDETAADVLCSPELTYMDGPLAPIFCFLTLYIAALDKWSEHWQTFVEAIESLLKDDDILSHGEFHGISSGTTNVERYFDIIRLLRTAIRWIEGTGSDFEDARDSIMGQDHDESSENYDAMIQNFVAVEDMLKAETDPLIAKLGRILHDVQTLKQDLQTAASLREISGANRMNEHLMFLAILTTIYLPLNLVAAVCGNSISIQFDRTKEVLGIVSFGVGISLLTYAFPYYVQPWIIRRKRKDSHDRPRQTRGSDKESLGRTNSIVQPGFELVRDRFARFRGLMTPFSGQKLQKRDQTSKEKTSKEGSSEDRSTTETV